MPNRLALVDAFARRWAPLGNRLPVKSSDAIMKCIGRHTDGTSAAIPASIASASRDNRSNTLDRKKASHAKNDTIAPVPDSRTRGRDPKQTR